jgi:hypothetical protein
MKKAILNRRSPSLIRSSTGSEGGPSQTTAPARPYEDELVLVVNDMQPGFAASADALTIYAIELQIRLAKAKNLPIIVVEYDAHEMGTTIPQIMRHLEGYARAVVVGKSDDDGSAEIFEAVIDNGFWPENYILCGVNSDACLLETVRGLIARVPTLSHRPLSRRLQRGERQRLSGLAQNLSANEKCHPAFARLSLKRKHYLCLYLLSKEPCSSWLWD